MPISRGPRSAFSVAELLVTIAIFLILSILLVTALQAVTRVWYRSSARDDALNQIVRAKAALARDLANSSQQNGQWASAKVPPHLTGYDGDALTFLSSDDGTDGTSWQTNSVTAACVPAIEITYYLVIPNASNSFQITCSPGPPDASGYEQQCLFKWLIRRLDPVGGLPPAVAANWSPNWISQPSTLLQSSAQQVVADQLLQFRVLRTPPTWVIQLSAVAVSDATRAVAVGQVPLLSSKFTVTESFGVPANN